MCHGFQKRKSTVTFRVHSSSTRVHAAPNVRKTFDLLTIGSTLTCDSKEDGQTIEQGSLLTCDVVDDHGNRRITNVGRDQAAEAFLACSVPKLQPHLLCVRTIQRERVASNSMISTLVLVPLRIAASDRIVQTGRIETVIPYFPWLPVGIKSRMLVFQM